MLRQLTVKVIGLLDLRDTHAILPEYPLSALFDVLNFLHGLNGLNVQVAIVD